MSEKRRSIIRVLRELQHPHVPASARRQQEARARILDATLELVLADGWHGLTMDGIARRAKVSKATIYRWWPSKGAVLFSAAVADGFVWPAFPDTGDFRADVVGAINNLVSEFSEPSFGQVMRAMLAGAPEDEHLASRLDAHLNAAPVAALTERLESAAAANEIEDDLDAQTLTDLVYGAVFRRWLLGTGELDRDFADAVAGMVLRAVRPGSG